MPECQKAGFGLSYWLECRRVRPESCGFRVGPIETRSSERCSTTDHVGVMGDLSIAQFVAKYSSTDENTPEEITDVLGGLVEAGIVRTYGDNYWPVDFWYVELQSL